jgi:hypothetical protein
VFADAKVGVMTGDQFDEVHWQSVYTALHDVPRLFQVWVAKQMLEVLQAPMSCKPSILRIMIRNAQVAVRRMRLVDMYYIARKQGE